MNTSRPSAGWPIVVTAGWQKKAAPQTPPVAILGFMGMRMSRM